MKQHPDGRNVWLILVISFVMALACACATLPPAQQISDMKSIAGKWEGEMTSPLGPTPMTMTINEDGTWEAIAPPNSNFARRMGTRFVGTGTLSGGKSRFKSDTTGLAGYLSLHEGGGRRVLVMTSDDGKIGAVYEPAKK